MLVFDIETTGLDKHHCQITLICTEDFATGQRHAYEFARCRAEGGDVKALRDEVVLAFRAAPALCAFNGIRFDLPFMQAQLDVDAAEAAAWAAKTSDMLESSRLLFKSTFSLNLLCEENNVQAKSSSGTQAISMARNGEWGALVDYCTDDVRILCDLYRKRVVTHPRTKREWDLQTIAPPGLYQVASAAAEVAGAAAEVAGAAGDVGPRVLLTWGRLLRLAFEFWKRTEPGKVGLVATVEMMLESGEYELHDSVAEGCPQTWPQWMHAVFERSCAAGRLTYRGALRG